MPVPPLTPDVVKPMGLILTYGYTALGAVFLWGRWGRTKLKTYVLSDIVALFPISDGVKHILEFLIFIVFGGIVGVALTNPMTPAQAIVAGLGWTSLLVRRP
jgi:hypothetical protein